MKPWDRFLILLISHKAKRQLFAVLEHLPVAALARASKYLRVGACRVGTHDHLSSKRPRKPLCNEDDPLGSVIQMIMSWGLIDLGRADFIYDRLTCVESDLIETHHICEILSYSRQCLVFEGRSMAAKLPFSTIVSWRM